LTPFFLILALFLAVSLFSSAYVYASTSSDARYLTGTITGTNGVKVSQVIELKGSATEIALIFSSNATYAAQTATVAVSIDNNNWITVDSVSLGTGTSLGKGYSSASKATTIPVNPASFPYLNITLPAIATHVQTITWSGTR
jgi:hypothetical protein